MRLSKGSHATSFSWISFLTILVVFSIRVGLHFEYTPDDSYIYMQYAKNVVHNHEVAFNPGEPSFGFTSPLWLASISAAGWFGADLYMAAKVLDLIIALLALYVFYCAQMAFTEDRFVALMSTAVLSTHIWFLRWSGSGMETSLAAMLSTLTVYALVRRKYNLGGLSSSLLVLTRPEAIGLVAIGLLVALFLNEEKKDRGKPLLLFGVWLAAMLVPWNVYAYLKFGTIIPNTALAKSSSGISLEGVTSTLLDIAETLGASDGLGIVFILGFLGLWVLKANRMKTVDGKVAILKTLNARNASIAVPAIWIFTLPCIYAATSVNVVSRYLVLISPMIILLTFSVPFRTMQFLQYDKIARGVIVGIASILVMYNIVLFETRVSPQLAAFARGMRECFVYIGTWLNQNTAQNESVLVADIGAIGYYSERRICDAAGLVSSELLPLSRGGYTIEEIIQSEEYKQYCDANYVIKSSKLLSSKHSSSLTPVLTRTMYGLSLASHDSVYYTVFRVKKRAD